MPDKTKINATYHRDELLALLLEDCNTLLGNDYISFSKTVPRLTPHACLRIGWQVTLPILSEKMSGLQTPQILILWIIVFGGDVSRLSKA